MTAVTGALAACALAVLPLNSSLAQDTATSQDFQAAQTATPFASHFADIIEPLGPNAADIDPLSPDTAVDLDTFEAPIEPQPEPAATSGRIRSLGTGVASYYGRRFHGRLTANGERFDMRAMTAAHKTLPFGSMVRVTNRANGRSVTVRINDRGPFIAGRTIDLSRGAAEQIGMISRGHARVDMELVSR